MTPRPARDRIRCRFCNTEFSARRGSNDDCGRMDKAHKDARWNEVGKGGRM